MEGSSEELSGSGTVAQNLWISASIVALLG
jgi:hypothetical protein